MGRAVFLCVCVCERVLQFFVQLLKMEANDIGKDSQHHHHQDDSAGLPDGDLITVLVREALYSSDGDSHNPIKLNSCLAGPSEGEESLVRKCLSESDDECVLF